MTEAASMTSSRSGLPRDERRQLSAEADRYGRFVNLPVTLEVETAS